MILISKIFTALAWIVIILNWLMPSLFASLGPTFSDVVSWSGLGLVGAHIIETLIFLPKAKKAGGNLGMHIVQLLLFGYVYNMELDLLLKEKG